jgi:hypothetical protein
MICQSVDGEKVHVRMIGNVRCNKTARVCEIGDIYFLCLFMFFYHFFVVLELLGEVLMNENYFIQKDVVSLQWGSS